MWATVTGPGDGKRQICPALRVSNLSRKKSLLFILKRGVWLMLSIRVAIKDYFQLLTYFLPLCCTLRVGHWVVESTLPWWLSQAELFVNGLDKVTWHTSWVWWMSSHMPFHILMFYLNLPLTAWPRLHSRDGYMALHCSTPYLFGQFGPMHWIFIPLYP